MGFNNENKIGRKEITQFKILRPCQVILHLLIFLKIYVSLYSISLGSLSKKIIALLLFDLFPFDAKSTFNLNYTPARAGTLGARQDPATVPLHR